eukprot:365870-Chlamydomonas_euryale.AAC.8
MKSASHGNLQVACIVQGSVPAAFSAHPCVQTHRVCQLLKGAIALPDLLLALAAAAAPPTAAVTCVTTSIMLLMRLLAGGLTASPPADPVDPLNSEILTYALPWHKL